MTEPTVRWEDGVYHVTIDLPYKAAGHYLGWGLPSNVGYGVPLKTYERARDENVHICIHNRADGREYWVDGFTLRQFTHKVVSVNNRRPVAYIPADLCVEGRRPVQKTLFG